MTPDPPVPGGPGSGADGLIPAPTRGARWREQLIAAGWIVLLWNLFWGGFQLGNLLGGALVAVAVLVFFPLPPVTLEGRLRPVALLRFVARFGADLVTASIHVAWIAVRPGYRPRSAIIAVDLLVHSDLNLTLTAEVLSLVPGTVILDVDRPAGTLYVHVFDVRGPEDLSGSRRRIQDVERRLLQAVGSVAEVRLLQSHPAEEGPSA